VALSAVGHTNGTLLACGMGVAQAGVIARRPARRVEVRVHLMGSTDIAFGLAVRRARRRTRRHGIARRWLTATSTAACIVIAALAPVATAVAAADLSRLGALAFPATASAVVPDPAIRIRPALRARSSVVTAVRPEAPALGVHVVAPDETLLSIAALYGVTPQTIAYNNNLSDTRDLRPGAALVVPPLDAAIHVVREGETIATIAAGFGVDGDAVRAVNSIAFEPEDVTPGRVLLLPVPDSRYPGFRLRVSDPPRVFAPRVRWPTAGVVTQLFTSVHSGIDIAAPYGSAVVASDSGTITEVGWRGPGGLSVCERLDWGLEVCDYHLSATNVEVGDRVSAGQRIASVGSSGESTGPHVHWEARTNGVLVDPLTYAPEAAAVAKIGSRTSTP